MSITDLMDRRINVFKNKLKKLPVGREDFKLLIEKDYYYVDKTSLIEELIITHDLVNLITRPRRFGKSLNLSMLQYFFEKSEQDNAALFCDLKISGNAEILDEHMGKYPVISLSFMNAKQGTYLAAVESLGNAITMEFRRHGEAVRQYPYRKKADRILEGEDSDLILYQESLLLLSQILYEHYGERVILLIDEYDVPLESAYTGGYYNEMLDFIRSLLRSILKGNPCLEFAVLTGCLRLAKESVFTGLNNFSTFSKYFGFSENEVKEMLDYYQLSDKMSEMRDWYDGYMIGESEIYNPWSVIKQVKSYLTDRNAPISHWGNTSGNEIIRTLVDMATYDTKQELELLLRGETLKKRIVEELIYDEVYSDLNNLWSFLFLTGYLTAGGIETVDGSRYANLRIPNREIHYIYEDKIKSWFSERILDNGTRANLYQDM